MTTSANMTYYEVYDGDVLIETIRQNCMCKNTSTAKLKELSDKHPDATLIINHPDEDEVDQRSEEVSLSTWIKRKDAERAKLRECMKKIRAQHETNVANEEREYWKSRT